MEREPSEPTPTALVGDTEREAAVETLQQAATDGRLSLEELSDRVGAALTAHDTNQLNTATEGIADAPQVGTTRSVSTVVAVLGNRSQAGRWRLPAALRTFALLGDVHLDLRDVVVSEDVVGITAVTLLGNLCVDVPEGVDVELSGFDVLGDRELRLARVPRRTGTPLIRVHAYGILGDIYVRTPDADEPPPNWSDWLKGSPERRRRSGG